MMNMHTAILGTTVQRGNRLIRIQQTGRVKCRFHSEEGIALLGIELHAHGVDLLDAHTVLTSHRAPQRHTGFENLVTEVFGAVSLILIRTIKQNQRMHIAVTCMKHVHAT